MNDKQIKIVHALRISTIQSVEVLTAVLLTISAIFLHFKVLLSAGALWRDEVNSANFAAMPSVAEIWRNMDYDSFPILTSLILRGWASVGLQTDFQMRLFGLLVGLAVLVSFWIAIRQFIARVPLLVLLLFALSPLSVRYVDSIRPYGLGILLLIFSFVMIWRVLCRPSLLSTVAAASVAILSVQALYQNALFLAAFILSAVVAASVQRRWRTLPALLFVPLPAAVSLLPYINHVTQNSMTFGALTRMPLTVSYILSKFTGAIRYSGEYIVYIWVVLLALAIPIAIIRISKTDLEGESANRKLALVFLFLVMLFSIGIFLGFLWIFQKPTEPWYYLPLMAIAALCLDALVSEKNSLALLRVLLVIISAAFIIAPSYRLCAIPHTNMDAVASTLTESADKNDLIIVNPWELGVSFQRYYHGPAVYMTIPPIEDHRIHRYDLIKAQFFAPAPLEPLFAHINQALGSGHAVWFVGGLSFNPVINETELPLPPLETAPTGIYGWSEAGTAYNRNWESQIASYLRKNCASISRLHPTNSPLVSPYEEVSIFKCVGSLPRIDRLGH